MLSCKEIARLVSESFDRRLSFWERFCLRFHAMMCRCIFCKNNRHDMTKIREVIRERLDAEHENEPEERLTPEARKRIQDILDTLS